MKKLITVKIRESAPVAKTAGALAQCVGAELIGDPELVISGVGSIRSAQSGEVTFVNESKYEHLVTDTHASLVIVPHRNFNTKAALLVSQNPRFAFAQITTLLFPDKTLAAGIHPSAVIGEHCEIDASCHIGPHCVIEDNVVIEKNTVLLGNCFVGSHSRIGQGTLLHPQVTVYAGCRIGQDCTLHAGVVIGSDGFGFVKQQGRWIKVPQVGGVVIGDRCEIGANTTIDRGAIQDTVIHDDVILDNLIQIGHNVEIGQGTAMAACTGVAGSTTIGKNCLIGGGSGIVGHIDIADNVILVGGSNVGQSVEKAGVYGSGLTITDAKTWKRNLVRFHQLDKLANRLFEVERKQIQEHQKAQEEMK